MKLIDLGDDDTRLVRMFAALSNPIRFRIMETLASEPGRAVADLVKELPVAQATISQHLKVLREADLIEGTRAGPVRCCRPITPSLEWFTHAVSRWAWRMAASSTNAPCSGDDAADPPDVGE